MKSAAMVQASGPVLALMAVAVAIAPVAAQSAAPSSHRPQDRAAVTAARPARLQGMVCRTAAVPRLTACSFANDPRPTPRQHQAGSPRLLLIADDRSSLRRVLLDHGRDPQS